MVSERFWLTYLNECPELLFGLNCDLSWSQTIPMRNNLWGKRILQDPRSGTLIFSNIRRLGHFFGVQNFEFQYFLGLSEKCIFLGYEDFVDIFGGHHKIGLYLGVICMHVRVFSKGQGTEWGIFLGVGKISIILGGA